MAALPKTRKKRCDALSEAERILRKKERDRIYKATAIKVGDHFVRFREMKAQLMLKKDSDFVKVLLDRYEYTDGCISDLHSIKHQVGLGEYLESWMTLRRQLSLGDKNLVKLLLQCYHAVKDCSRCSELVFPHYQKQNIVEGDDNALNLSLDCESESSDVLDLSDGEIDCSSQLEGQPGMDIGAVKESAEHSTIKSSSELRSGHSQKVALFFTNTGETSGDNYSSVVESSSALKEKSSHSQDDVSFPSPSQITKDSIQNQVPNTVQSSKSNVASSTIIHKPHEIRLYQPNQSAFCAKEGDNNVRVKAETLSMEYSEFAGTVTDSTALESSDSHHLPVTACRVKTEVGEGDFDEMWHYETLHAKRKKEENLLNAKRKIEEGDPDYKPELGKCNEPKKKTKKSSVKLRIVMNAKSGNIENRKPGVDKTDFKEHDSSGLSNISVHETERNNYSGSVSPDERVEYGEQVAPSVNIEENPD